MLGRLDRSLVGLDQFGEDVTKFVDVWLGKRADEVAPDALLVSWPYLLEPLPALAGQGDVEASAIVSVELAANESVVLHSIEHAGEAAAAEGVSKDHRGR